MKLHKAYVYMKSLIHNGMDYCDAQLKASEKFKVNYEKLQFYYDAQQKSNP